MGGLFWACRGINYAIVAFSLKKRPDCILLIKKKNKINSGIQKLISFYLYDLLKLPIYWQNLNFFNNAPWRVITICMCVSVYFTNTVAYIYYFSKKLGVFSQFALTCIERLLLMELIVIVMVLSSETFILPFCNKPFSFTSLLQMLGNWTEPSLLHSLCHLGQKAKLSILLSKE